MMDMEINGIPTTVYIEEDTGALVSIINEVDSRLNWEKMPPYATRMQNIYLSGRVDCSIKGTTNDPADNRAGQ